ncbi:MAG: transposase [Flavobacterium sp.]|nr:MAG: transposase [Flavobacterium sp.]
MSLKSNKKAFTSIINHLGIDETLTKINRKKVRYNKFIDGVVPEPNWNYMSDLIELPKTEEKNKYLLVVVDLATNKFDIEPLKSKTAEATLNGFKEIIKRKILTLPEISLKTDNGTEFRGVFNTFLLDHKIFHKVSLPFRKTQMAPVESLNATLGRLLTGYMNKKSVELGIDYMDWDDILPQIRTQLNEYRERDLGKLKKYQDKLYFDPEVAGEPDFQIGDYVRYRVERPIDIRGNAQPDQTRWRMGDRRFSVDVRQIIDILCYPQEPYYRYKLSDMPNVSYSADELLKSDKEEELFIIKQIIGKKVEKRKVYYLCWWKGELKRDATWQEETQLREDGAGPLLNRYDEDNAPKPKKTAKKVAVKKKK